MQNNVSSGALMEEVDKEFCTNNKQIAHQIGAELQATFRRAKARFRFADTLPTATPVPKMKTTLLEIRADVKFQVLIHAD